MGTRDEYHDRLIDILLREQLSAEEPPDLEDRILARAHRVGSHRRLLAVTGMAATAAVLLIVATVLIVVPMPSVVGRKSPRAASRTPAPQPPPAQVTTGSAARPLISATVRVPVRSGRLFRVSGTVPIPTSRARIPTFNIKLPRMVTLFDTERKKRSS